jgi:acid phosphatase (class A)
MTHRLPHLIALAMAFGLALSGSAFAAEVPAGYLDKDHTPDAAAFLTPPPALGSDAAQGDLYAFHHTRALEGSDRWKLAIHDDIYDADVVLADFDCALGARLDAANAPRLLALLIRVQQDGVGVVRAAKKLYRRDRPIAGNDAPFCKDRKAYAGSFSFPSGHATMSWAFTVILAELAPDRTNEIMARGRAYGESRVVCGAHWPTDLEAGHSAGAALVAALHGDAAFRADLDAARAEVVAARAHPQAPDAAMCKIEDAASAHQPW